jgi:hypothetical protein
MTIFGGKISTPSSSSGPTLNYFHVAIVAPWLLYLSTGPTNWEIYLKLTALGVGSYHLYRAYCKVYHPTETQPLHKADGTVLSMMF